MTPALFGILLLGGVLFTLWPLLARQQRELAAGDADHPVARLQQRKETLLGNIADLDFEHSMGKMDQPDYEALRGELVAQAAAVLDQLQRLEGVPEPAPAPVACASCGRALPDDARFCPGCGEKVA